MNELKSIPGYSVEAEMSLLGSMILSQEITLEMAKDMSVEDFFRPAHKIIFKALCDVAKTQDLDIISLRTELIRTGQIADCGGVEYLMELAEFMPSSANARTYAQIIKDKRFVRESSKQSSVLIDAAQSGDTSAELYEKWQSGFNTIRENYSRTGQLPPTVSDVFKRVDDKLEKAFKGQTENVYSTGFPSLDRLFGGFFPGDQYILAGYSGTGKTAMMAELIFRSCKISKAPWLIVSGEMTDEALMLRYVQSRTGIKVNDIRAGRIDGTQYQEILEVMEEFWKLPIHIVSHLMPVNEIYAKASQLKSMYGNLAGVGVDYIQMMTSFFKGEGVREFDVMMNEFKVLAKDQSCSTLLLSQLNRGSQKDNNPPALSDLKGTSGIESSGDVVMGLHRPNVGTRGSEPANCHILKARFDQPGVASLEFVPSRVLWREVGEAA